MPEGKVTITLPAEGRTLECSKGDNLYAVLNIAILSHLLTCPHTEARERSGDAGNVKRNCLQWCITPRLVIGRIYGQIIAD